MAKGNGAPGVYSATYSGIPVWEFQFGVDLKEHVMRRRHDDWINATHILKAAGFDKPARTRILEREVQKDTHEKIQGGYGKYQGTWIPLEAGETLAQRNNVYDRLQPIFEFTPGPESPPPAPRHTSKPKAPRKPAVPKWTNPPPPEFDSNDLVMHDDDTPDNLTVASASYMAEDDRFELGHPSTGHRKRKRELELQDITEQQHGVYGDELLDYFLLSRNATPNYRPDPPPNFQPDWVIDSERHTALHWASAMGDIEVIKQLKRFGASLGVQNARGETPFMRAVHFTNCHDKKSFPQVMKELFDTVDVRDAVGSTVIHHAAAAKPGRATSQASSRYYMECLLNRLAETHEPTFVQHLLDAQDKDGNTALHLAAQAKATKLIRALLGRNASTDIPSNDGIRADELIQELNLARSKNNPKSQRSSSPFGEESHRDGRRISYHSGAASAIQSRIGPLILDKVNELAESYDDEWVQKDKAEKDAQRILAETQAELAAVRQQVDDTKRQLESDEVVAKINSEANVVKHMVVSLITHQSRVHIQQALEQEMARLNGDISLVDGSVSYDSRLALARQLQQMIAEQRQAEVEYVEALSVLGTNDKIEKYKRLLRSSLDAGDSEILEENLDGLIEWMEEQPSVGTMGMGIGMGMDLS